VLRRPSIAPELMIQFAPELFSAAPAATVDAWLASSPPLTPLPLLPALLRATAPNPSIALHAHSHRTSDNEACGVEACRREAIRYLHASVARGPQPVAVHNLLLSLLAAGDHTAALLRCVLDTVAVRLSPSSDPPYLDLVTSGVCEISFGFCYFTTGHVGGLYPYSHTHYARPPTREWWNWLRLAEGAGLGSSCSHRERGSVGTLSQK
jgi:hypothetical protein